MTGEVITWLKLTESEKRYMRDVVDLVLKRDRHGLFELTNGAIDADDPFWDDADELPADTSPLQPWQQEYAEIYTMGPGQFGVWQKLWCGDSADDVGDAVAEATIHISDSERTISIDRVFMRY